MRIAVSGTHGVGKTTLIYLPLESDDGGEYPKLRRAMDRQLNEILTSTNVAVVEATGSTAQRLRLIESALQTR